uniref:Uncharacterized protein n=1 Tax=Opuntia streptacantha TaxID=393608 RepID=A0A7C9CMC2_OPUST
MHLQFLGFSFALFLTHWGIGIFVRSYKKFALQGQINHTLHFSYIKNYSSNCRAIFQSLPTHLILSNETKNVSIFLKADDNSNILCLMNSSLHGTSNTEMFHPIKF